MFGLSCAAKGWIAPNPNRHAPRGAAVNGVFILYGFLKFYLTFGIVLVTILIFITAGSFLSLTPEGLK